MYIIAYNGFSWTAHTYDHTAKEGRLHAVLLKNDWCLPRLHSVALFFWATSTVNLPRLSSSAPTLISCHLQTAIRQLTETIPVHLVLNLRCARWYIHTYTSASISVMQTNSWFLYPLNLQKLVHHVPAVLHKKNKRKLSWGKVHVTLKKNHTGVWSLTSPPSVWLYCSVPWLCILYLLRIKAVACSLLHFIMQHIKTSSRVYEMLLGGAEVANGNFEAKTSAICVAEGRWATLHIVHVDLTTAAVCVLYVSVLSPTHLMPLMNC